MEKNICIFMYTNIDIFKLKCFCDQKALDIK